MDLLQRTKNVIRSLLISSPKLLTIHELNQEFSELEGYPIPCNRLGYSNLNRFLLSVPDVLEINSNTGTIVPVTSSGKDKHIHEWVSLLRTTKSNRRRCSNNRSYYHQPAPKIKINLLHKVEEIIPKLKNVSLTPPRITENELLRSEIISNEEEHHKLVVIPEAVPSLEEDDPIHSIGSSLLDVSTVIPSPTISGFQSRHTYKVFIGEINRPWRFWFSLCDNDDMKIMEDQLMWHYEDDKLTMKESAMIAGKHCLVFYKNKWLRAEFVEKPMANKIKVCFVDYGTIDIVATSQCRLIKKYFSTIPKRCFSGALEFIKPIENRDVELRLVHRFSELVRDKQLIGFVKKVDHKNQVVRMVLIDTSDEKDDIIINRELLAVSESSV